MFLSVQTVYSGSGPQFFRGSTILKEKTTQRWLIREAFNNDEDKSFSVAVPLITFTNYLTWTNLLTANNWLNVTDFIYWTHLTHGRVSFG